MKWIYKLDYKFGRYHIRNLMRYVVGGMVVVYVLQLLLSPINLTGAGGWLSLWRDGILSGQVWRLITFIFIPEGGNVFLMFISLYVYYLIGNSLENIWGGFRLNLYYLIGILGSIASVFVSPLGYTTNTALNLSLFLAFATLAPDTQFLFFFVIPLKAKWLAIGYVGFMAIDLIRAFALVGVGYGLSMLIAYGFSLVNYLLFFGPTLISGLKDRIRIAKNRRNWRANNRNR